MYRALLRSAPALACTVGVLAAPVLALPSPSGADGVDAHVQVSAIAPSGLPSVSSGAATGKDSGTSSAARPSVQVVRSEEFQAAVLDDPGPVFVEVFSPSCTACKALAPMLYSAVRLSPGVGGPAFRLVQIDIDDNEELPPQVDTPSTPRLYFFPPGDKTAPPHQVPMLEKGDDAKVPGLPSLADILGIASGGTPLPPNLTAAVMGAEYAVQRMTWMYEMSAPVLFWVVSRGLEELTEMGPEDLPAGVHPSELSHAAARLVALQGTAQALADAVQEGGTYAEVDKVHGLFVQVMHELLGVVDADVIGLEAVAGAAGLVLWADRCHFADPDSHEYALAKAATGVMYGKRLMAHEAAVASA